MNHFSRMWRIPEGQKKQVNTLDDCHSDTEVMFIGAISAENKEWVEIVRVVQIRYCGLVQCLT